MMTSYIFVGERPSHTAFVKGWTWKDGRLAGRTLFAALAAAGIDPAEQKFRNLFGDTPSAPPFITDESRDRAERLWEEAYLSGATVVALGDKVARALTALEVPHKKLIHPAARGAIRARDRYIAHVRETLAC